jgi:hypothetical protein
VLRQIAKLMKLFKQYASERPFEFLLMPNSVHLTNLVAQICQEQAPEFNKPSEQTDGTKVEILKKVAIGGIEMFRSLLTAVANPNRFEKGIVMNPLLIRN